jgi:hypothetical protein
MFIEISAATLLNSGAGKIKQADEGLLLNLDHVRYARFRESTSADKDGTGASSQLLTDGTPCVDIWTGGDLTDRPAVTLFFPEEVGGDFHKLRRLLTPES